MDKIFKIIISIIILAMVGIWMNASYADAAGLLKSLNDNQKDVQVNIRVQRARL